MTNTPKTSSSTRHGARILSGDPLGIVRRPVCDPESHANTDRKTTHKNGKTGKTGKTGNIHKTNKPTTKDQTGRNNIRVLQANLHKSKAATSLIGENMTAEKKTHIALITEPHSYKKKIPNITNNQYKLHYATNEDTPRACIMISNEINHIVISELSTRDSVAILVETETINGQNKTILASVYQPPGSDSRVPTKQMKDIVKYAQTNKTPLVIGCDANGHHEM